MTLPSISSARARVLLDRFTGRRVLVAGDVMLDRFIVGDVTRISPEAPVPVVRFHHEDERLGGAANVAHNLTTLGAQVTLIGVVGTDAAGGRLREQLRTAGIADHGLIADRDRPTVEKVRVVTRRNQQVARIDYEDERDITGDVEARMLACIAAALRETDVLVASDYLKGSMTAGVVGALTSASRPCIIDPKIPHLDRYAGATIVTPNHHEAEAATHRPIRSDVDAQAAARDFRTRVSCTAALITRGEQGMWLSSDDAEGAIPAVAREVSDVTGAGDTVVATLALALAAGATLAEAAVLANQAAGIVVGKFGPATVTRQEMLDTF